MVSAPDTIDAAAAARAVGVTEPMTATPLVERRGKGVWRIDTNEARFALRILRPDEHATAEHEQQMMRTAAAAGLPVPEVLASSTWDRRPVLLLTWCEGRTLQDELRRRPWAARALGRACGRMQAALHRVSLDDGAAPGWLTRFGPVDEALAARLAAVESGERRLLHLDLHPTNVLVAAGSVTALLDWTNAAAGDPRADLARSLSMLTSPPPGVRRVRALVNRAVAVGWREGYEQVAGGQADMALFELWALSALSQIRGTDVELLERDIAARRARLGLPS